MFVEGVLHMYEIFNVIEYILNRIYADIHVHELILCLYENVFVASQQCKLVKSEPKEKKFIMPFVKM